MTRKTEFPIEIRRAVRADAAGLLDLYRAAGDSGGLARRGDEVEAHHIDHYLNHSLATGISLVALQQRRIVADLHAWPMEPAQFAHVLSDLTIAVHPDVQRQGLGRRLFDAFIVEVRATLPRIRRIELGCRESNARALRLYTSVGFVLEGRLKGRVYDPAGFYEDDLLLGLDLTTTD